MTTLLQSITAITAITAGLELLTDVGLALLILSGLNLFANACRYTYKAGQFLGRFWYRCIVPLILRFADFILFRTFLASVSLLGARQAADSSDKERLSFLSKQ